MLLLPTKFQKYMREVQACQSDIRTGYCELELWRESKHFGCLPVVQVLAIWQIGADDVAHSPHRIVVLENAPMR